MLSRPVITLAWIAEAGLGDSIRFGTPRDGDNMPRLKLLIGFS